MVRTGSGARAFAAMMGTASLLAAGTAAAQETAPLPRPGVNLYGQPGLIDLPSAEMMPDGEVTASYSYFGGTHRRNLTFQILPRVAATVRYASISDWSEPGEPSGNLSDRSFDVTFQLLQEEGWRPGVAVGLRDFLGTGTYSSEFIVATKRLTPDVAVSAGIGWGRLGSGGGFGNPFCDLFGGGACDREEEYYSDSGDIAFDRFFQGEGAAPFAGIEWRTPVDGLTLKAEYSPDDYEREQASPAAGFERKSRLNFGAEYRVTSGIMLGGYWMYGSEVGVNLSISANPFRPLERQDLAPGPIPVAERPANAPQGTGWASNPASRELLGTALAEALAAEGVRLEELRVTGTSAEVLIVNERLSQDPLAIGRTVRVLQTGMPASVGTFAVTLVRDGLPVTTTRIDRLDYERLIDRPRAGEQMWAAASVESAGPAEPGSGIWRPEGRYPDLDWSIFPVPFVLDRGDKASVGLAADAAATWHLSPEFSISGRVSQLLLGRSSDPGPSGSALPPVRSENMRYYAGYEPRVARLTADYVTKLSDDVYARASGGYLERMFAGVSGEVLWKPSGSPIGFGVEVNYVAQRDNEGLGLGQYDYDVATGHASLYWDTGWKSFEVQLDAGRYLAGDWGSTLRVTRHFPNGWAFGAYTTLTDVSAEDFGDGSFDKGVTLEIPLSWATPFETRARTEIELGTGARDGGARLDIANRLYDTVRELDRNRLERNWGAFWQ